LGFCTRVTSPETPFVAQDFPIFADSEIECLNMNAKQAAAKKAIEYIKNGMTLGLGTGSTAYWAIQYIGEKVKEGLKVRAIATSIQSQNLAIELGIPIVSFADAGHLDLTIDGADEVDENLQLIKGGGGALLREKIVAAATKFYVIIVDDKKLVKHLGNFKLPVEVIPFGWELTSESLKKLGCSPFLRVVKDDPFLTDNGNYILDCAFGSITAPSVLHEKINSITGVVDNGLFIDMADCVIAGSDDGKIREIKRKE
jgi:ribose 5-phosphate isomerase A